MKLFISLLLASLTLTACDNSASSKSNSVNDKTSNKITAPTQAIEFALPDLAGKPHQLNEYLEKGPVMLVFYTTWCPYCKKEIPKFKQVYQQYYDRGLQLVAINAGMADSLDNAKRYALQYRLPYIVLYDAEARVSGQYGLQSVPKIFYIQQDGRITHRSTKVHKQSIEDLLRTQG